MNAPRTTALLLALGAGLAARAADTPVAPEWPAIDSLVSVDLLTPTKLKEPIVIDLATGGGADKCPGQAWTGQAIFLIPGGDELVYWGTGIYCAPIGYGRVQYSDGRTYSGQVNSFLASASATLTMQQFRPAVRHGNGKLERKGGAPMVGNFQRGALAHDRSGDPQFMKAMDAAESSLPDRFAPMMTSAVAAFAALPATAPAPAAASATAQAAKMSDSVAQVGAAAVQQASMSGGGPASSAAAAGAGGSLFTAAGAAPAATGAVAFSAPNAANPAPVAPSGSGMMALPAPLPPDYQDMSGMLGYTMATDELAAQAKQLTKEYQLKTRGNGIFYGAACPKAGFLGIKHWRARVTYTETFSGTIVFDGVGLACSSLGPGRVEFEDGSVYEGMLTTFTKGAMNPVGNFEPGVPSGPGKFTFPDGTVVEGTWSRGELNGGPITVTKPGKAPQAFVSGTLASLRSGATPIGGVPAATMAKAPNAAAPAGNPMTNAVAQQAGGGATMSQVAAVAAASMGGGGAAPGNAAPFTPAGTPFTPAGAAGTPFTPAGGLPFTPAGEAGAVAAVAGGPGSQGPRPILGNTGKYLCPYTEDGTVALWVDKAIKARMGGAIGGMVGAEAGKELFKNIPMFGGMFGKAVGDKVGRETAIKLSGGWEYIRANTDQSFDNVNDYVTWLRLNYKGTEHYNNVVTAIKEIYPELKVMQF